MPPREGSSYVYWAIVLNYAPNALAGVMHFAGLRATEQRPDNLMPIVPGTALFRSRHEARVAARAKGIGYDAVRVRVTVEEIVVESPTPRGQARSRRR